MIERLDLMKVGSLTLVKERWDWGNVLQFEYEELSPDPYYPSNEVQTEISCEGAKELIKHLQRFVSEEERA